MSALRYPEIYAELTSHAKDPVSAIKVNAHLVRREGGLDLSFNVAGPGLKVTALADLKRGELWKHTCFEIFARLPGRADYWEWNFSPAGRWDLFAFSDYRTRLMEFRADDGGVKSLAWDGSRLAARIESPPSPSLDWALRTGERIEWNVTSVLELTDGKVLYRAVKHPAEKPDFHDARGFVTSL